MSKYESKTVNQWLRDDIGSEELTKDITIELTWLLFMLNVITEDEFNKLDEYNFADRNNQLTYNKAVPSGHIYNVDVMEDSATMLLSLLNELNVIPEDDFWNFDEYLYISRILDAMKVDQSFIYSNGVYHDIS